MVNKKHIWWWQGSWSPANIGSTLVGWYESYGLTDNTTNSYGVVASGRVTQLSDLSSNGNHFTVPGGSNAPQLSSGKVLFTKTNSEAFTSASLLSAIAANQTGEIVTVIKKTAGESFNAFAVSEPGSTNKRSVLGISDSLGDLNYFQVKLSAVTVNVLTGDAMADTQLETLCGSSNGTAYKLVHNAGGITTNDTITVGSGSNNGMWWGDITPGSVSLGALIDSSSAYYTGSIYAVLVFTDQLSTANRTLLLTYLSNRYSV